MPDQARDEIDRIGRGGTDDHIGESSETSTNLEGYAVPNPFEATPETSRRSSRISGNERDLQSTPIPNISHSDPSPPLFSGINVAQDPLSALRSSIQNTPLESSARGPPPSSPTPPHSQGSFLLERASAAVWPIRSPGRSREGSQAGSRSSSRAPRQRQSREVSGTGGPFGMTGTNEGRRPGDDRYPTLITPELFMPLPNTDPLQTLLSKYVPPAERPFRDTSGRWQGRTVDEMVASSSWRSLATYASDNLLSSSPTSLSHILTLWYIRLQCLLSLQLPHQHLNELTSLFNAIAEARIEKVKMEEAMPFELEVFWARRRSYMTKEPDGDGRGSGAKDLLGAVDDLGGLERHCMVKARDAKAQKLTAGQAGSPDQGDISGRTGAEEGKWLERARRVKVVMAGLLTDMREYAPAIALLEPLLQSSPSPSTYLSLIYLHLALGTIPSARALLDDLLALDAPEGIKQAGLAAVQSANADWKDMIESSARTVPKMTTASANNLAVALLNDGQLEEATRVLDETMSTPADATTYAEPLLFNLTTVYELQSGSATQKKVALLKQVAEAVGDGLRPGCLKLS